MATVGKIEINKETCKGCQICIPACPKDVISLSEDVNSRSINFAFPSANENCTGCLICAVVCPDLCITVYREVKEKEPVT